MSTVIWLPEAVEDLDRLFLFLKNKSLPAAKKAAQLIRSGADLLKGQPQIGRLMEDDSNNRELFLPFGSNAYVLRYKWDGEMIVIIRVWHGREIRV